MGSSFRSNDISISDILNKIDNGEIQLPDFQRGWVWDDDRIKALIASISNSYPVGALMFLEYGGDKVKFKYRPFTGADASTEPNTLVLDGQQRLTSIFGSMKAKEAMETCTTTNKPIKRFYYLDIEKCLDTTVDRVDAILSIPEDKIVKTNFGRDIEMDISTSEGEYREHMFPLNIAHDIIKCSRWQNDYQRYHEYAPSLLDRYAQFNAEVLVPIQGYKIAVITLDKDISKEAVCQVFENVNTGGVPLTVFELMTATYAADNFELRKDWDQRQKNMISKSALSPSNTDSALLSGVASTDFLIAITLLSRYYTNQNGGEAVSCKKDVFKLSLDEYKKYNASN